MRIVVLAGGISPERDVSLTSGSLIANALISKGHTVALIDVFVGTEGKSDGELYTTDKIAEYRVGESVPDLDELRKKYGRETLIGPGVLELCSGADAVFLALHGAMGENGQLQATLDNFNIKYTGSGYIGSLLAMDKDISKRLFVGGGILTPEWVTYNAKSVTGQDILNDIGLPCVIKPCSCGSSVGVTVVENEGQLEKALGLAAEYEQNIIAEKKIVGRELTAAVLDGQVLPAIEIIPKQGFYDYRNKYQAGMTEELCPAPITDRQYSDLADACRRAFDVLRLRGYARFDFIMDNDSRLWLLEANTLPGMTPTSLLPQMARETGIDYATLCDKIVRMANKD